MHEIGTNKLIIVSALAGVGFYTAVNSVTLAVAEAYTFSAQEEFLQQQTGYKADGTPVKKR